MNHPDRVFSFKEVESENDLVEALTNHKWPKCYGFYHEKLLYLGDGYTEDEPIYTVVTVDKTEGHHGVIGREVGRIKPLGMQGEQVKRFIQDMNSEKYEMNNPVRIVAEPMWHHSCQFCRLEDE